MHNCIADTVLVSALSRAILKLVYQFGIPNIDTQTLQSVKID